MSAIQEEPVIESVAIIGMAGRFPQAKNIEEFWHNLCTGTESIITLSEEEDHCMQVDPALRRHPFYVPRGAFIDGIDLFDAPFFGYNAREAQIMDPQQRLFLECAWEAIERAGYDTHRYAGRIGVYAGTGINSYLLHHVYNNANLRNSLGSYHLMLNNDRDFFATRVAYKLGLKGPALTVQTACSTSLVAVSLACQSLLSYQCDMALAGAVSLPSLTREGFFYEEGGIASPDGYCRAFDDRANGTVFGNGLGVVVLKRLSDALADGDQIYSVIKAVAVNNDGDAKMGYTAPSVEGQAETIIEALALADVAPEQISYVEAHGTGTALGDPIEMMALTKAFQSQTQKTHFCALGSVKTNIGHLDTAAGIAGLIKTSLALTHKQLPASLHFEQPNAHIDFAHSPFYVNTSLQNWQVDVSPRYAGVSAFGIGGTNAHVILEEPPQSEVENVSTMDNTEVLFVLSAKTSSALDIAIANLASHLETHPEQDLADIAYTLLMGRRVFDCQYMLVCQGREDAIKQLRAREQQQLHTAVREPGDRLPVFMFPGQGAQYRDMGRQLYEQQPVYRYWIDYCAERLQGRLGSDIRTTLYPHADQLLEAEKRLQQTALAQVALFATSYALARLLESWNISPQAMIGHSVGEYVAACLSGVMLLDDALSIVEMRGRLMQKMEPGAMLTLSLSEQAVHEYLTPEISLAAVNGPAFCVVSGTIEAIEQLQDTLTVRQVSHRRLHVSHAFHSWMMDAAANELQQFICTINLREPQIPFIASSTGTWITDEEATDPHYWAEHIRQTVRFAAGIEVLLGQPGCVLLEVGPGETLATFCRQICAQTAQAAVVVQTMRHPYSKTTDLYCLWHAIGTAWLAGIEITCSTSPFKRAQKRVLLPTYPFERQRYWLESDDNLSRCAQSSSVAHNDHVEFVMDILSADEQQEKGAHAEILKPTMTPGSEVERQVTVIWQEYLGIDEIDRHDNFFSLGGHSLVGIRLMARLRQQFHIDLPERTLYEHATVAALSEAIEQCQKSLRAIEGVSRAQTLRASWNQRRAWIRDHTYPDQRSIHNLAIGWELHGSFDMEIFRQAMQQLVDRHETMRTYFAEQDGDIIQIIAPAFHPAISFLDLSAIPEDQKELLCIQYAIKQELMPFDMQQLPLWRCQILCLDEKRHIWILTAHQSIWDGISTQKIMADMNVFMDALLKKQQEDLPPLEIQYADVASWEFQHFKGDELELPLSYWRQKLAGTLTPLLLPTDRPRKEFYELSAVLEWDLNMNLVKRLKQLAQETHSTLFIVLLTSAKILWYQYTGQDDILVETSFSNREYAATVPIVAPLANFVPLRTDLSGDPSCLELLERVRETTMGAIKHHAIPFSRVQEELFPNEYRRHLPLGRILIAQYQELENQLTLPDLTYHQRLWFRRATNDLYIAFIEQQQNFHVAWEYDTHLFERETVQHMFHRYLSILERIVENPTLKLSDFTLAS